MAIEMLRKIRVAFASLFLLLFLFLLLHLSPLRNQTPINFRRRLATSRKIRSGTVIIQVREAGLVLPGQIQTAVFFFVFTPVVRIRAVRIHHPTRASQIFRFDPSFVFVVVVFLVVVFVVFLSSLFPPPPLHVLRRVVPRQLSHAFRTSNSHGVSVILLLRVRRVFQKSREDFLVRFLFFVYY